MHVAGTQRSGRRDRHRNRQKSAIADLQAEEDLADNRAGQRTGRLERARRTVGEVNRRRVRVRKTQVRRTARIRHIDVPLHVEIEVVSPPRHDGSEKADIGNQAIEGFMGVNAQEHLAGNIDIEP